MVKKVCCEKCGETSFEIMIGKEHLLRAGLVCKNCGNILENIVVENYNKRNIK